MPTLKIKWHTTTDPGTTPICNICQELQGYEWTFDSNKDRFPNFLNHPTRGDVWNTLLDHSMAHGYRRFYCRCHLEWEMTDLDLKEAINKIKVKIETLRNKLVNVQ